MLSLMSTPGIFGHRATMLDLDPNDLKRFKQIAKIVGFENRENVRTALALSGSSAQSRIQAYPADADFFERIHITAPTREEACRILGEIMRDKALSTLSGPTHRLWEVKLGTWEEPITKEGKDLHAGSPISWTPSEIVAGEIVVTAADGGVRTVKWEDAAQKPGWCKLDWVVADASRGQLANASNVLDPTWRIPRAGSCRSTAFSTRISRRSISTRTRSRSSTGSCATCRRCRRRVRPSARARSLEVQRR